MTSKLKCLFCPYCNNPLHCGAELNVDGHNVEMWYCTNYACEYSEDLIGTREMWEAFTNARHIFAQGQENTKELAIKLIQAKQDLEQSEKCCSAWETQALDYKAETIALSGKLEIARKALEYYADSRFGKKQDDGTYVLEIDKGCGVTVVYTYDPRPAKQALSR